MRSLWLATTSNRKTGNIPTSYIDPTVGDMRRSSETAGCPLLTNGQCGWRDAGAHLLELLMARCDSLVAADEAVDAGGATRCSCRGNQSRGIVTPLGRSIVVCPAQVKRDVNCNTFGLCDTKRAGPDVIGFLDHGLRARGGKRQEEQR